MFAFFLFFCSDQRKNFIRCLSPFFTLSVPTHYSSFSQDLDQVTMLISHAWLLLSVILLIKAKKKRRMRVVNDCDFDSILFTRSG